MAKERKPTKTIPAFRIGNHIDSKGRRSEYTEADILELASSYDTQLHVAPIVKGHPEHDKPAYGSVQALSVQDGKLFAEVIPSSDIEAEIDDNKWLGVSPAIYGRNHPRNPTPGKLHLRHLGLCGAVPPAVKGGGPLQSSFAEDDTPAHEDCFMFDEVACWMTAYPFESVAELLRNLRERIIAKDGIEEADQTLPNWKIDSIDEAAANIRAKASTSTVSPIYTEEDSVTTLTAQQIQALQDENAALKKAQADAATKRIQDENTSFCEKLIADKKLLPKDKEVTIATLNQLAADDGAEFGEGDGKKPLLDAYKDKLGAAPAFGEALFSEQATGNRAKDPAGEANPLVADAEARAKK